MYDGETLPLYRMGGALQGNGRSATNTVETGKSKDLE